MLDADDLVATRGQEYELIVSVFTGRDAKMVCWWRLHIKQHFCLSNSHTQPARAWRLGYKICLRSGAWSWLQSCFIFPCLAVFSYRSGHKTISVHAIAALFQLCVVLGFSWCGGPRTLNFWTSICFVLEHSFFFLWVFTVLFPYCFTSLLYYMHLKNIQIRQWSCKWWLMQAIQLDLTEI